MCFFFVRSYFLNKLRLNYKPFHAKWKFIMEKEENESFITGFRKKRIKIIKEKKINVQS